MKEYVRVLHVVLFNSFPTGEGNIVSPLAFFCFFVFKFPEIHILTPNWVTFPKISYKTRKKQFFEIGHSIVT